ncbi:MAG TPA: cytidylate kinase family protein [Burkholderiales bacterium]|jgi:cytidylate kinase|nr:cytidylate kinase family protein [Burkholderiales bacterium]
MPVIAMTMEVGTRGSEVAAGVAQALGMASVGHELAERVADKMHVKKSLLQRLREGKASMLERVSTSQTEIAVFTAEEVYDVALKGNVLIRGWGSTLLLRPVPHIPCVRVCAPLEARVRSLMQRLDTDDDAFIRDEIQRSDEAHAAAMQARFHVKWGDPLLYDLTLNTERVSIAACIEQVVALAGRPEFLETDASRAKLANLALEARVRAAFMASDATAQVEVTVVADGDRVTLRGMVQDEAERKGAAEVAHKVPGVKHVHSELRTIRRPRR